MKNHFRSINDGSCDEKRDELLGEALDSVPNGAELAAGREVNWILYLFAAGAGALNTVQAGANAQLRKSLDEPVLAGLAVYITGFVGLAAALPFVDLQRFPWSRVSSAPWWAWLGGALSIVSTMAGVLLARKMGSAAFTAMTVTFSLVTSVTLDHFGLVGFEVHRANPGRLLGCVLLIAGVALVTRF